MSAEGRCLGLVGGLGPGATVHYYRGLIAAHACAENQHGNSIFLPQPRDVSTRYQIANFTAADA